MADESEYEEIPMDEAPEEPDFPILILIAAIGKDILDVVLTVTIVGAIFTGLLSFVLALVLFFWILGKTGGGWWKKALIRKLWMRYVMSLAIEFLPVGNIIPANTIFVLMAHYSETKAVKLANEAFERLRFIP
jgi:hypothetical protein